MTLILYTFALLVALVLGLPYWLLAMATNGKYREGLSERLGWVPDRLRKGDARKTIWVHAVSVGEVLAASRLVNELSACAPQYRVLLSTTTRTGQRLARERTGANHAFYFPLDFPWIVRRYLRALDPVLLVLVETELWPNLLTACRQKAISVAVVNGRISDRSLPRYLRLRRLWKGILSGVSIFLAQSQEDVKRLKAIGAPAGRVSFAGNRKETCVRRSNWMKRPVKIKPGTVILLDSIGELASVYALASVAFVGGSLVPAGGHNPLEPAQFAVPVVMGNHYANFRAIIDTLLQAEALKLATTETLVPMLENLLTDEE